MMSIPFICRAVHRQSLFIIMHAASWISSIQCQTKSRHPVPKAFPVKQHYLSANICLLYLSSQGLSQSSSNREQSHKHGGMLSSFNLMMPASIFHQIVFQLGVSVSEQKTSVPMDDEVRKTVQLSVHTSICQVVYCRYKLKGALLDKLDAIHDDLRNVCGTNL